MITTIGVVRMKQGMKKEKFEGTKTIFGILNVSHQRCFKLHSEDKVLSMTGVFEEQKSLTHLVNQKEVPGKAP